jgi:hypothetical protein
LGVCGVEQLGTERDAIGHWVTLSPIGANVEGEMVTDQWMLKRPSTAPSAAHQVPVQRPRHPRLASISPPSTSIKTGLPYTIAPIVLPEALLVLLVKLAE